MDDRELETRLSARLHTRLDDTPVPRELLSNVRQAMTTAPASSRVGFQVTARGRFLGWTAMAATVAIVVVAVMLNAPSNGPAAPGLTASPPTAGPPTPGTSAPEAARRFIVLPPDALPDKAVTTVASDILAARLHALGVTNFTSGAGYAIEYAIPPDGPSDDTIRTVLGAAGDVTFVPIPPAAYESRAPEVGDSLPTNLPALFGHDAIMSVQLATSSEQGFPVVDLVLTPSAAALFGDYTASHQGEYFAIVIDGKVALMPIVNEPIPGGHVQISSGSAANPSRPDTAWESATAILVGGRLPKEWQGARVPVLVSEESAIAVAKSQFPLAPVASTNLDAEADGDGWRAIWVVVVTGVVSAVIPCPTESPEYTCPVPGPTRRVVIDAERGDIIRIEYPPE